MDIIKTIFRLSFFLLGCVMLMFTLLVISVDARSVYFFLSFSLVFYLLGYKYTFAVIRGFFRKAKKILHISRKTKKINENKKSGDVKKVKDIWVTLAHENLSYNKKSKEIKLNSKTYSFDQIVSVDLYANSKKVTEKELMKLDKLKGLEIKIGTKIKKVTYRNFKYITSAKITDKVKKRQIKNSIKDFKELTKLFKKNCK